jgi:mono/diheme cytochrome c family protein
VSGRVSAIVRAGCLTIAAVGCAALSAAAPRSAWSGVYTNDQASAGEKVYYARCSSCHGDGLGGIERAPALAGTPFLENWRGKSLRRLLDRIDTMPPTEPKSLSPAEATAVLAFLLRSSEMPSGAEPLPADRAQLGEISFEPAP